MQQDETFQWRNVCIKIYDVFLLVLVNGFGFRKGKLSVLFSVFRCLVHPSIFCVYHFKDKVQGATE
ncbi:hypothetical protein B4W73_03295 [Staphylococcus delphini]|nr:hypothetical protein B5B98_07795 [Staphylococcus delphini]PCF76797.1 hypothetical protein B4W73_03295 [Staphylococcus delphini]